jgi:large repetitive protein
VTVDLGASTVTEAGFGPVAFTGIETFNVSAGGGAITVLGAAGPDAISVTPTGTNTATMTLAGLNLTINTDNTGTLTADGAGGNDMVTVHGTSGADTIDVVRGATTTVTVNGMKTIRLPQTSEALTVAAGAGADTINVTGTQAGGVALTVLGGGPASLPPLAHDRMNVTNVASGTTVYTPGDSVDSGMLSTPDGVIAFQGLEYVNVVGTGADTYAAHGTNGPDAITLQNNGANRIWINNQSVLEFSDFATVNLLGRFGSDTFSVHPAGLVGVATINIDGGDPTASDVVIVTGTTAQDNVTIDQLTYNAARVVGLGPALVVATVEHLTYSGLGGNDQLTVITPAGPDTIGMEPGAVADAGLVLVSQLSVSRLPIAYQGMGILGAITLADVSGNRTDTLEFLGTDLDDAITVRSNGDLQVFDPANGANSFRTLVVHTLGVVNTILAGLDGSDVFNVPGNHPFVPAFGIAAIRVEGGNPSASDVLNFTGSGTGEVTIDLQARTVTENGFGPVAFTGIETFNVSAGGGAITVLGTAGPGCNQCDADRNEHGDDDVGGVEPDNQHGQHRNIDGGRGRRQ